MQQLAGKADCWQPLFLEAHMIAGSRRLFACSPCCSINCACPCCWLQVAEHKAEVMVASHNQASIERTVAGNAWGPVQRPICSTALHQTCQ
jgi:hypothetical protein